MNFFFGMYCIERGKLYSLVGIENYVASAIQYLLY